ncbi:MAG: LLM class flavin-dependent oxidoreductase [Rhodospirillaceae bacterium]|nr:LLM class flavin-dependent oxidoreductase [Rhodospirillaceae bacterium]|tara:strand:- start:46483 stop:47553 length:1071 start_codon:yes stop_codon:yes gene_type:complete
MKFSLSIDLSRGNPSVDIREVAKNTMELVQMADAGGFEIVWAAEHHAIEMTIAPNPFQLLAWFGGNTDNIRLGVAVVQAPYWHPIKVAGEAGLLDLMSGGRLELGLGRGAYQREFNRMAGGMDQHKGVAYMQEMLPVLKHLWAGDYAHDGEFWQFPASTACPKPLQKPHPPLWVAARHPSTYDWALQEGCNIMSWALTRPFNEVEKYKQQFEEALERAPGVERPRFLTMRHSAVYADAEEGWRPFTDAMKTSGRQFESLFKELGEIKNGFAEMPDESTFDNSDEYDPQMLKANLMFGTPDEVIKKLRAYEALGVDNFLYRCCTGLAMKHQRESLRLFIEEVMPAFEGSRYVPMAAE